TPPQLTGKRVRIGQADLANIGLANMADHHLALDRIALHQARHLRINAGGRVLEQTQPAPFIKADTPPIAMRPGSPATLHQPGEAEHDIGGHIRTHAEQFTHRHFPLSLSPYRRGSIRAGRSRSCSSISRRAGSAAGESVGRSVGAAEAWRFCHQRFSNQRRATKTTYTTNAIRPYMDTSATARQTLSPTLNNRSRAAMATAGASISRAGSTRVGVNSKIATANHNGSRSQRHIQRVIRTHTSSKPSAAIA